MIPQKKLFLFWLPLFASWLLMTVEGPIVSAVVNRLPNEVIMLASMGIVVSLSVTIESPIINLLSTSTALAIDRPSYLLIRRFTVHWMIFLTLVTILLAFTPLFELVVVRLMNVPAEVAYWVQQGLKIMSLWSAAIAWRRFLQGIMIRFDQTRKVAWGTVVRLVGTGGTVIVLGALSDWPGVIIGSAGLMVGVLAEATFATLAVRPILNKELAKDTPARRETPLTYNELFWFHLPLAATSLLALLVQPLVAFSLTRSANPTISLAAWPVVFQFTLVARSAAFALPEVVIALYDGRRTFSSLRRFSLTLVVAGTAFMMVVVLTPLLSFYLLSIQDLTLPVAAIARLGLVLFIPFPALATLISWLRGLFINQGATRVVNMAMAVNLIVTTIILVLGILNNWPGIPAAAVALCLAATIEFLVLWWQIKGVLDFRFSLFNYRKRVYQG
jgi:Na+-driven multidrug efflux pump